MNERIYKGLLSMLAMCAMSSIVTAQTASSPSASTSPSRAKFLGPLGAGQLRQVRGAGQSVLGAQRQVSELAEVVATREALQALSQSVNAALILRASPPELQDSGKNRQTTAPSAANSLSDARVAEMKARWKDLKERRTRLQTRADQTRNSLLRARMRTMSTTALDLENEADRALRETGRERFQRLMRLRERLAPKALNDRLQSDFAAAGVNPEPPTPTLATITKHR